MKRMLSLLVALTLGLALTACQETPEESLVTQKSTNALISAALEEPAEGTTLAEVRASAPETYTYDSEGESVAIVAENVPVIIPEGDTIAMYYVDGGQISQEQVDLIYNYFYPDGDTYVTEGTDRTKDYIEQVILETQQKIAELQERTDLTEEEWDYAVTQYEEQIARYQEELADAPEESTLVKTPTDSTLTEDSDLSSGGGQSLAFR